MKPSYSARQKLLSLPECERLYRRSSREIPDLAIRGGWQCLPGERVSIPVGYALNMLVSSDAMNFGFETHGVTQWLPGLRNEALLKLGEDFSSWSFDGTSDEQSHFWPILYGGRDAIRPRIAPLLGCCTSVATRQVRVHSQNDTECLSNTAFESGNYDHSRTPRFILDAHDMADRMRVACEGPLFTVQIAVSA